MTTRIKLRRDTAAAWTTANPILAGGEPGLETDTGKIKYGDGVTTWRNLDYATGSNVNTGGDVTITAGNTEFWVAAQRRESKNIYGRGVRHDSQGNVYSLTETEDDENTVSVITKYSPAGAILWQHTIDQAQPCALAIDSSDCAYIALEGNDNVHLIKFTTGGNITWKKSYDAGNWQGEAFIEERTSTRLAMTLNRNDSGANQVLVLDIDTSTGDAVTQKILTNGLSNMNAAGIDTDSNGNVFVTGRYYNNDASKDKMFVEKLDADLNRVWSKSLETDNTYNMSGGDCASDAQGNVYAVGLYDVDTTNFDSGNTDQTAGVLIKLNSNGVVQWTRRLGPGPCGLSVIGLTATGIGDVYLVSSTLEFKRGDNQLNEFDSFVEATGRMMLAKYNTSGAVIWQRYVDASHVWENNDDFRGQTVSVFNNKVVVDFYGNSSNTVPWNFSGTDDNEYDYFLAQLPADGTELQIGDLAFKESRIPGRFVTHETSESPTANGAFEGTLSVDTSDLTLDPASRVANALVKSEAYNYVFGSDGTLTIPNDGDIKLTQNQIGWLGVIGPTINYDNDLQGRAVTADSQGNMYAVGEDDDDNAPAVVKISPEGHRLWGVTIENNNGDNGRANGIAINPLTGNILVACEFYGNYTYGAVITIDQDTGRILDNTTYIDENNDVYLNDIAFQSTGDWVVGGSKNGNFGPELTATPVAGSGPNKIVVSRTEVPGPVGYWWQIGGTGFTNYEQIANVEQYNNLTSTVVQGSGAVFAMANNGDGTYGAGTISAAGSGYKVGHKIKVLGTALGGATPANDAVLTVYEVDNNGGIVSLTVSGTAAGGSPSGKSFSDTSSPPSFDGTNTISFSIRNRPLIDAWTSFNVGDSISFVVGGTTYTSTISQITGSSVDPMNPIPYTLVLAGTIGAPSGTVTLFTVSNNSGFAENAFTSGLSITMAGGPNPNDTLDINTSFDPNLAAYVASIPSGATIKAWDSMFNTTEFTLTSAFTNTSGSTWKATFTRTSGNAMSLGNFNVITTAGGGYTLYPTVSGSNFQTGSGFGFSYFVGPTMSSNYSEHGGWSPSNYGSNYVVGDVIKISGTQLGGTSPANDLTITVSSVGGGGEAYGLNFSGTAQTANWNIATYTNVDFSQPGSWTLTYPLSRENILIGDGWARTYGTNTGDNTDSTYAIAVDSSDNIIAVTEGYGQVSPGNNDDLAVVYKFNSSGQLQWARQLNELNNDCYGKGVTTIGTDIYVTHYSDDEGETVITKLDASGAVKWQRRTDSREDSSISATTDGNLVIVVEAYNDDISDDAIKLFKMTPNGETIYKRWLYATTNNDTRFQDGRSLAVVGGNMYITSYYYADDYDSWFVAKLPEDGSGLGEFGQFRYTDVNAETGSFNSPGLTGVNYVINEVGGSLAGALNVEPYVNSANLGIAGQGEFYVNSYYPDYFYEDIRDQDGGNIVFADGTTQNTSATDIPQRIYTGTKYTLGMKDRGHHIYCRDQNNDIIIPYHARVPFPIGTTITIVNDSGNTVYIYTEGGGTQVMLPGNGFYTGFQVDNYGVATLLKIGKEKWVITGNVTSD